jgi:hypothetical protein
MMSMYFTGIERRNPRFLPDILKDDAGPIAGGGKKGALFTRGITCLGDCRVPGRLAE